MHSWSTKRLAVRCLAASPMWLFLAVGLPYIVDKRILGEFHLPPEASLSLALPVRAVVKTTLRFDFAHGLRIVLGHPAVDVV
jgi:hypothetical protein